LALTRLRKTHPQPRLTIPLADQKLVDQVTEMQTLNDEVQSISKQVQGMKGRVKTGALEVETLRAERTEAEKAVKMSRVDEDDGRLIPLYDWYVLRSSICDPQCAIHQTPTLCHFFFFSGTQLQ
jgi:hypothetical protein